PKEACFPEEATSTKKARRDLPAGVGYAGVLVLLEFDVIARVDLRAAEGQKHGCRVVAHVEHNALPEDFAGKIFPCVVDWRAAETVQLRLVALGLRSRFMERALVTKHAEIVADLDVLRGAEIHENRRA